MEKIAHEASQVVGRGWEGLQDLARCRCQLKLGRREKAAQLQMVARQEERAAAPNCRQSALNHRQLHWRMHVEQAKMICEAEVVQHNGPTHLPLNCFQKFRHPIE